MHYEQTKQVRAKFIATPGLSNELINDAKNSEISLLPVQTPQINSYKH
nr:hypothetical protein [Bartonella rattimassiliensis]